MNDFYVGYIPTAPPRLVHFIRVIIAILAGLAVCIALVLVTGQRPFANSVFEYGKISTFEGIVERSPYATLLLERPGEVGNAPKFSHYFLVAPGKLSADNIILGLDGKRVRLQGQLIYRDGGTMIEVQPGSITSLGDGPLTTNIKNLGVVTVTGEIVDSKCYLGVMNPGQGKVHRDCASRCLSGGIPPLFIDLDNGEQYLLVGPDGNRLERDSLKAFVAEPITLHGELLEKDNAKLLQIDVKGLRHTADQLAGLLNDSSLE